MNRAPRILPFEPGTRVRVGHMVRVGSKEWKTFVTGTVDGSSIRPVGGMEMGSKAFFSYQPTLRLKLDDGEITTLAIDEQTTIETLSPAAARPASIENQGPAEASPAS
jgi:hypothetical protein